MDVATAGGSRIKSRWLLWLMITATVAQPQNTTDPAEARVLNEMFRQWGIPRTSATQIGWNLSGEPCSGTAVEPIDFEAPTFNPGLKCDCNFPNFTCHITQM
ncbi:hypothetical protein L1987_19710 [Smallanthus sonchifolius]|uniref:Uncharacterized protein n=1 Tax=Smallanthus sonchifolius TaxID=185202 RepID=A0ACB9IRG8_9ASTR|nr:hypothetical protein L1987_19710 [Smallanthus sonchifolius]